MKGLMKKGLDDLTNDQRSRLEAIAKKSGLTVEEWVEFSLKAQIYQNAEEILALEDAA